MNIRALVDEFIASTGQARWTTIDGEPAIEFLDENETILLSDIAYDSDLGFYHRSLHGE